MGAVVIVQEEESSFFFFFFLSRRQFELSLIRILLHSEAPCEASCIVQPNKAAFVDTQIVKWLYVLAHTELEF